MTQLSTGSAPGGQRRNNGIGNVGLTGTTGSLVSPGLVAAPPAVTDTEKTLAALDKLLGQTGNAFGAAGNAAERVNSEFKDAIDKQIKQALQDGLLDKPNPGYTDPEVVASYEKGLASKNAMVDAGSLSGDIEAGRVKIMPGESLADAVNRVVSGNTAGLSDAYKLAYQQTFTPHAIAAVGKYQDEQRRLAIEDGISNDANAAVAALSPESIGNVLESISVKADKLGLPYRPTFERVMYPAIDAAANKGQLGKLKMIAEKAPAFAEAKLTSAMEIATRVQEQHERELIEAVPLGNRLDAIQKSNLPPAMKDALSHQVVAMRDDRATMEVNNLTGLDAKRQQIDARVQDGWLTAEKGRELWSNAKRANNADFLERAKTDVAAGIQTIDQALISISDRVKLPVDDPLHIGFSEGKSAMQELAGLQKELDKKATDRETVRAIMNDPQGRVSATPDKDNAILAELSDRGVVAMNGESFVGVNNPEKAAALVNKVGRMPSQMSEQIASTLNTGQAADQIALATRSYAAIYKLNPLVAAQIETSLTPTGKARVAALKRQLDRQSPTMLDASGNNATSEWTNNVKATIPSMLGARVVDISHEQVMTDLFGTADPIDVRAKATSALESSLPEGLQKGWFPRIGWGNSVTVFSDATEKYKDFVAEEYRAGLATGLSNADAVVTAQKSAMDRVLALYPPVLWNKEVRVGKPAPYSFTGDLGNELVAELQKTSDAGQLPNPPSTYAREYYPVWNANVKVNGDVGAWVLLNKYTMAMATFSNGQVFAFTPKHAATETVAQMRQRFEERNRRMRYDPRLGDSLGLPSEPPDDPNAPPVNPAIMQAAREALNK